MEEVIILGIVPVFVWEGYSVYSTHCMRIELLPGRSSFVPGENITEQYVFPATVTGSSVKFYLGPSAMARYINHTVVAAACYIVSSAILKFLAYWFCWRFVTVARARPRLGKKETVSSFAVQSEITGCRLLSLLLTPYS